MMLFRHLLNAGVLYRVFSQRGGGEMGGQEDHPVFRVWLARDHGPDEGRRRWTGRA